MCPFFYLHKINWDVPWNSIHNTPLGGSDPSSLQQQYEMCYMKCAILLGHIFWVLLCVCLLGTRISREATVPEELKASTSRHTISVSRRLKMN